MNQNFSHMIFVRAGEPAALVELLEQWKTQHASADVTGFFRKLA